MQMYPGWSARDNYAQNKKKNRKNKMGDGKSGSCSSMSASSINGGSE